MTSVEVVDTSLTRVGCIQSTVGGARSLSLSPVLHDEQNGNGAEKSNNQVVEYLNEPKRSNAGKKRGRPKKMEAEQEDSNQFSNRKSLDENNGKQEEEENKATSLEDKMCDAKNKKGKKMLTRENALMCHQCQRNDKGRPPEKKISEENQRRYAFRIVDLLLPWLKELQQEQMKEKELEGKLQGVSRTNCKACSFDFAFHAAGSFAKVRFLEERRQRGNLPGLYI
uniref:Uncharacterized protein n=1 Tax=Oryza punctata TaxID=4537 RepID=A0A0E0KFB8_ORYPU